MFNSRGFKLRGVKKGVLASFLIFFLLWPGLLMAEPPANILDILKKRVETLEKERREKEAEKPPADSAGKALPVEKASEGSRLSGGTPATIPTKKAEEAPSVEVAKERQRGGNVPSGKIEKSVTKEGVSFYFDDADVFEVINTIFGEILKVNYIVDPKIGGRVNFRTTTPIPETEILQVAEIILRLNGIAVVEEGGLYRIIPIPEISSEPISVSFGKDPDRIDINGTALIQIVPLDFIDSTEMSKILNPLLTKGGVIMDIPSRNYLMIADTDANIKRMLKVVQVFDKEDLQAVSRPKVFVYPLQNAKADHIAEILQEIFLGGSKTLKNKTTGTTTKTSKINTKKTAKPATERKNLTTGAFDEPLVTPGTKIFSDEITNSLIILATPRDYPLIEEVIKEIDVMPRQVLIEALVAEVTLKDEFKFGLEWYLKSHFNLDNTKLTGVTGFGESVSGFDPTSVLSQTGFTFAALDAAEAVRGLLQTLATDQKVNVIASPHVMVSDNREARIQVGDQLPVQTSQSETSAGTLVTSVQYRDTGSTLKVKPHINEGGLVSLEITQELSFQTGTGVQDNPIISNRTAETHVVVQDGQTIVIGGLIRENEDSSRSGIPVLKDIPILGYLFGATETSVNRTELIVLITPHVVRTPEESSKITDLFRKKLKGLSEKNDQKDK